MKSKKIVKYSCRGMLNLTGLAILLNVTQHIKMYNLGLKFKIEFLLFPKWLFFQLNFAAKIFEIRHLCS